MVWSLQSTLSSGEISPGLFGNSASPIYLGGMREFQNGFITRQGGARKRWGTRFLQSTQGDLPAKLRAFRYSTPVGTGANTVADYIIEITSAAIRAFKLSDESVFTITSSVPYADADIPKLQIATIPNLMVISHENFEPRLIKDPLNSLDTIDAQDFGPQFGLEQHTITLQRTGIPLGGSKFKYEASDALFISTDKDVIFQIQGGWVRVIDFTGPTEAVVEELEIAPQQTDTETSNVFLGTPFRARAVGPTTEWDGPWIRQSDESINMTASASYSAGDTIVITATAPAFTVDDVGELIDFDAAGGNRSTRIGLIVGFGSTTAVTILVLRGIGTTSTGTDHAMLLYSTRDSPNKGTMAPDALTGSGVTLTAAENVFNAAMVAGTERFPVFYLHGGSIRLTSITGPTIAEGTVLTDFTSLQPTTRWGQSWGPYVGFPRAVTFFQDRLVFGGLLRFPSSLAASRTGRHENFRPGALADDGLLLKLSAGDGSRISWVRQAGDDLMIGTEVDEFRVEGLPLATESLKVSVQSSYGSSPVQPIRLGTKLLFVDREGRSLRDMEFRFESNRYESDDLTDLADHLFQDSTIRELAYFKRGEQLVMVVMEDGTLRVLTNKRRTGILGWSPWLTGAITDGVGAGKYLSATEAPDATEDRIWFVVERVINGVTKRYIEIFEPNNLEMDSVKEQTGQTSRTVTGLTHLALQTAEVMQDDIHVGSFPVSAAGEILLDSAPTDKVAVGLRVAHRNRPNHIAVTPRDEDGSVYGRIKEIKAAAVFIRDSFGGEIEGFQAARIPLDQNVTLATEVFTGWIEVRTINLFGTDPTILITHDTPHTFEVLAVNTSTEIRGD